jgi:hypothetical protein
MAGCCQKDKSTVANALIAKDTKSEWGRCFTYSESHLLGNIALLYLPGYVRSVGHELTDEISLELGRRVAVRLGQQPELLRIAHENQDRWTHANGNAPALLRCYTEWREILNRPLNEICSLLTSNNEEAQRLRQNSPFAGVLNAREVWEVKQHFRHATTST